jgi:predicted helicase
MIINREDNLCITKAILGMPKNEYDNTKTIRQNIGTFYEYFVRDQLAKDYDQVWHWLDFPEEQLYELGIIKDYNIYSKYRNDLGADLVAVKDNIYYFVQCKNFSGTIVIDDLAGFYFFLFENKLNGILC